MGQVQEKQANKVEELANENPFNPVLIYLYIKFQYDAETENRARVDYYREIIPEPPQMRLLEMMINNHDIFMALNDDFYEEHGFNASSAVITNAKTQQDFLRSMHQDQTLALAQRLIGPTLHKLQELNMYTNIPPVNLEAVVQSVFKRNPPDKFANGYSLLLQVFLTLNRQKFQAHHQQARGEGKEEEVAGPGAGAGAGAGAGKDQDLQKVKDLLPPGISGMEKITDDVILGYLQSGHSVEETVGLCVTKALGTVEEEFNEWQDYIDAAEAQVGREWTSERRKYKTELLRFMRS